MNAYTVSHLALDAGVSVHVVRDYMLRGLLRPVACTTGGYGLFDAAALQRLCFVRDAFEAGIGRIYTLRYLRDPQLQRDVHRSENRIESYHQLRSTIAQVNGKKELTGRTDLDVAVSNHCGRLIANVVIAYNSMLLSGLLGRYLAYWQRKSAGLAQANLASGVAAPAFPWTLRIPRQAETD